MGDNYDFAKELTNLLPSSIVSEIKNENSDIDLENSDNDLSKDDEYETTDVS